MTRRPPAAALVVVAFLVPFAALVLQAVADRWYGRALVPQQTGLRGVRVLRDDPTVVQAVVGSFTVAVAVAVVAVVLAWPAARYLAATRSPAAWALLGAPVLLPPLVLGDGLATWLLQLGLGDGLVGIAIAHLPVAVPYAALALVAAFDTHLAELEHGAALAGASPRQRLVQVVLPASRRHVALALALAFTVSWSQYATSLAVGGGTPMLPLVLVPYVRSDPQVAAVLSLVFLLPPVVALGAAARVGAHRRRIRRATPADTTVNSTNSPTDDTNAGLVG